MPATEDRNRATMHVNPLVYVLVALFGSSSWLSTNSVWMQLSLMTQELPEKWSLPSYLALIVQVACVGPLLYSIVHKCTSVEVSAPPLIFVLLSVCTMAEFVLAFTWDWTTQVWGAEHSVALFVLMFVMALVNATSNVLFMPFMATFHPSYLTAYFVGMGLSSLVPSLVSLVQGTSQFECVRNASSGHLEPVFSPARFHVAAYTLCMGAWLALTVLAFGLLHCLHDRLTASGSAPECRPLKGAEPAAPAADADARAATGRFVLLSVCLAAVCAQMNAVVPSVQSYATMPYSQLTYHLALALSALAHPVASFLPLWFQPKGLSQLIALTAAATVCCSFVVVLALQSPDPIGLGTVYGPILSVGVSVLTALLHAFSRTVLTSVMREDAPHNQSRLFWCGVFMQVGSFAGSLLIFPLVNVAHVFQSAPYCRQ